MKRRRETGNIPSGGGKGVFRLVESVGAEWEEGEGGEALRVSSSQSGRRIGKTSHLTISWALTTYSSRLLVSLPRRKRAPLILGTSRPVPMLPLSTPPLPRPRCRLATGSSTRCPDDR